MLNVSVVCEGVSYSDYNYYHTVLRAHVLCNWKSLQVYYPLGLVCQWCFQSALL